MLRTFAIVLSLCVMLFVFSTSLRAAPWQDLYEANTYQNADGQKLPYRLMKPEKIEPGKTYPLVLFLHGAGERGEDNAKQLVHGAGDFAKPENRQKYPCFVVAPQCPSKGWWAARPAKKPSPEAAEKSEKAEKVADAKKPEASEKRVEAGTLAKELVDKLAGELPVDKSRIYITGLSMGGYGTWGAIAAQPDYFAAAIPICGGGDVAQAGKLTKLPIWAFHGDADKTVPPKNTTSMIEAIQKAGGEPKMTIYPGVDHNSWSRTYADPKVLAWLFAQKKK